MRGLTNIVLQKSYFLPEKESNSTTAHVHFNIKLPHYFQYKWLTRYTSFGNNPVQVANLFCQTIDTLQKGEAISMVIGLTVAYWLSGRRHYTMSAGLLQFHLLCDLNLTSGTFVCECKPSSRLELRAAMAGVALPALAHSNVFLHRLPPCSEFV